MTTCKLCPRNCKANRAEGRGFCGVPQDILISKIMLHRWEEPCISGKNGSGAVFFCGCPLKCAFCQNGDISRGENGIYSGQRPFSEESLARVFTELQAKGAHNINLVSPTQYTDAVIRCVSAARSMGLSIPIVWNTGGYEKRSTVTSLKGTANVFLTDMKYHSSELSAELSCAPDYFERAMEALDEMLKVSGCPTYDSDGMMTGGIIVRLLVLPGQRDDSARILHALAENGYADKIVLSLMSQYTPDFFTGCKNEKLARTMRRRITTFEYNYVRDLADSLGFSGYGQERSSAQSTYTPEWGF